MRTEDLYSIYLQHPVICTDTRRITSGCLFFALKGDNFDGNIFASQALDEGAAFAVIDDPGFVKNQQTILVGNVLETLQQLANYHRRQLNIPFVGITGTNGKTTTKELIKSVLSVKYKTYATQGNLNNHIGVPLTLLAIDRSVEIAIVEMGANHQKEIESLCKIAEPDLGLITNVGKGHLEGFGGFEGVKKGKGELYDFLKQSGGRVFLNKDSSHLLEMAGQRKLENVFYYSTASDSDLKGELIENDPFLTIDWISDSERHRIKTNLTGPYNLENILVAIAVGRYFNLSPDEINEGISAYVPGNNRSQITKTEHNTLICDYYNANPSSMAAALDNFASISAGKKVLILGDMFELGDESYDEHRAIAEKALQLDVDRKILIGKAFYQCKTEGANFYESTDEALKNIKSDSVKGATVLIKGSRGMRLEKLAEVL
ncbi:UDP-N-acetylmuramoyl-tripeptide--D-alanyl-D-alanine ligase [Paradesertivirga mongoliensis]|uniref:UDP-N-acetylmuramoyl-tripeptide--D-alanyl-D-alanine ligase n=1 Tax=Paradesertivirga mongoliensis TaxID=2100740 RepID=A0ABW4ZHS2_9SPHI|nr:UDP-N-acetylmuramoyl-tripeptide--D-alanyl-D-alanine ligase [Pedobacter mongoliensis]